MPCEKSFGFVDICSKLALGISICCCPDRWHHGIPWIYDCRLTLDAFAIQRRPLVAKVHATERSEKEEKEARLASNLRQADFDALDAKLRQISTPWQVPL